MLTSTRWTASDGRHRGQSPTGPSVASGDRQRRPCADGAIGHVQVKGDNVLPGYWRMPERNK